MPRFAQAQGNVLAVPYEPERDYGFNARTRVPSAVRGVELELENGVCRGIWVDGVYLRADEAGRFLLEEL
jgi:hypothetical protein